MSETLLAFISGLITMGFGITSVFFLKFWRETHDRLFLMFAIAFLMFTVEQTELGIGAGHEDGLLAYLLRIAGFGTISLAIILKNRGTAPGDR